MAGHQADQREDPTVAGHAEAFGRLGRAQQEGGRLVDRPLAGVPLVVRKGQGPVGRRRRGNLPGVHGGGKGGGRVVPGHPVEALPQGGDIDALLLHCLMLIGPERVVDHGVLLDRLPQAVGHLDGLEERTGTPVHDVGRGPRRLRKPHPGPPAALVPLPSAGLAPHHHGHIRQATGQGFQGHLDDRLLGDAELHQVGAGPGRTDAPGHQAGRVGVSPASLGDGDAVDGTEQGGGAGILGSCLHGPSHQLGGRGVVGGDAHPHQDRRARVGQAGAAPTHHSPTFVSPTSSDEPPPEGSGPQLFGAVASCARPVATKPGRLREPGPRPRDLSGMS